MNMINFTPKTFDELYIIKHTPDEWIGKKEISAFEARLYHWNHFFDQLREELENISDQNLRVKYLESIIEAAKIEEANIKDLNYLNKSERPDSIFRMIERLEGLLMGEKLETSPEGKDKPKPAIETPELLKVIEMIKSDPFYSGIKGKRLKILFIALTELKVFPPERTAKAFHEFCRKILKWDIASYPAMNDYKYNASTDSKELNQMKEDINSALNTK